MRKLHCIVCDRCRKVINDPYEDYEQVQGKKRRLDYCLSCFEKLDDKMKKKRVGIIRVIDLKDFEKYRKNTSLWS
mgnify:CR=1 FL=1